MKYSSRPLESRFTIPPCLFKTQCNVDVQTALLFYPAFTFNWYGANGLIIFLVNHNIVFTLVYFVGGGA